MAEFVDAAGARHLTGIVRGPDREHWTLARVWNERYGTEMGIRKIHIDKDDNDISKWFPAPISERYPYNAREINQLRKIQFSAFGSFSPAEVIRQALFEEKGEVYVDQALLPMPALSRIYAIVIDKKLELEPIEKELKAIDLAVSNGDIDYHFPGYFTDHNGLGYPADWPEVYEIGRLRHSNVKPGIATDFLKLVKKAYEDEHGKKSWWGIIRVNNISSLKSALNGMGRCATRLQAPPSGEYDHFSEDTNFGVDSTIPPLTHKIDHSTVVWNPTMAIPSGENFLIRMPQGNESDLKFWRPHIAMLKKVMAVGEPPTRGKHYVMRRIVDRNKPHLYFTKDW